MLNFAVEYQKALDTISADREMDLRKFELTENEWKIAIQLHNVLKVCHSHALLSGKVRRSMSLAPRY